LVTLGNNVLESSLANERGQMVSRSWAKDNVNVHELSFGYGSANNGNLMSHGISGRHLGSPFSFQQGFDYDSINRLRIFQDTGLSACGSAAARQRYVFDRFGNRAVLDGSCGNGDGAFVPWVSADSESEVEGKFPNNRWQVNSGDTTGTGRHDGSGNVNAASGNLYEYDAENRMVKATAGGIEYRYRYDGEGRRVAVEKWTAGVQDTAYTRRFVYGLDGELLAEIQGTVLSGWETKYLGQDHLGTTRLVMKASGSGDGVVGSRHDYYPFGEELPGRGMNYGDPLLLVKYTGHERDNETGLDFMQARYYGGGIGRFTSPDAPFADQDPADPQSWNLYVYGRNNPLLFVDPTGQYTCHSSVSAQECTNFQDSLNAAQTAADALKQKHGANSSQYADAQRAIDAYGKAGVDNGVVIKVGNTGSAGANTAVAGVTGAKTKDNRTGQQIAVTFNTGQLGKGGAANASLSAHEGSHAADGSAWVASGFKDAMNPTRHATEFRAHRVQLGIAEGAGYLYSTFTRTTGEPELMYFRGWPQANIDARINYWLGISKADGGMYGLTPDNRTKPFVPGSRFRR
jgi:RHS repeat-associated protein